MSHFAPLSHHYHHHHPSPQSPPQLHQPHHHNQQQQHDPTGSAHLPTATSSQLAATLPSSHQQQQQQYNKPPIVVTENDVLSGRGVNIAAHPGNERFRTLVTTRADTSYCESYSASEKKAVAEEIVRHIANLNPPGRFLKREGRGQVSRGLNGPWEELNRREAIKKTCQALRDCNRSDRESYATGVAPPEDVKAVAEMIASSGMALKERAMRAASDVAATLSSKLREAMERAGLPEETIVDQLKRQKADPTYIVPGFIMTASGEYVPLNSGDRVAYASSTTSMSTTALDMLTNNSNDGTNSSAVMSQILPPTLPPPPTGGGVAMEMTGLYSMYPHPAVDAPPFNMDAHLAARAAAGYIHPDDRLAMEKERIRKEVEEEDIRTMKEEDIVGEEEGEEGVVAVTAAAEVEIAEENKYVKDEEGSAEPQDPNTTEEGTVTV